MRKPSLASLIREGRIERVERDPEAASGKLEESRRHLASAEAIAESDPAGAYSLLYDAARKAIDAHMLASGLRVATGRLGAHRTTVVYAEAALRRGSAREDVSHLDRMRRNRNRSEYGVWAIGMATLRSHLGHAARIVQGVEEALRGE